MNVSHLEIDLLAVVYRKQPFYSGDSSIKEIDLLRLSQLLSLWGLGFWTTICVFNL
jgi:hypothetical protein